MIWRIILGVPLMAHGLAHLSGFLAAWTSADLDFSTRSMLLSSEISLYSTVGKLFGLLWLLAAALLASSGVGLLWQRSWGAPLALAAALISLAVIIPWWNIVPPGAKVGAAFDLLVIVVLLSPLKAAVTAVS